MSEFSEKCVCEMCKDYSRLKSTNAVLVEALEKILSNTLWSGEERIIATEALRRTALRKP